MTFDDDGWDVLIPRLLGPAEAQVSCEHCFELVDAYVDAQVAGTDADQAFPGMRAHLVGCPACLEEHAALHELVRLTDSA